MKVHLAGIAERSTPDDWQIAATVPLLLDFDDARGPIALARLERNDRGQLTVDADVHEPTVALVAQLRQRPVFAVRAIYLDEGRKAARVLAVSAARANVDAGLPPYSITVTGADEHEIAALAVLDMPPAIRAAEVRVALEYLDHNARMRHRCDEACRCPVDGLPMSYAPSIGQRACQDPDCEHAHPKETRHG